MYINAMNGSDMKNMTPVDFGLIKMSLWVQENFWKAKMLRISVNGQKNLLKSRTRVSIP